MSPSEQGLGLIARAPTADAETDGDEAAGQPITASALAALGVVYGDIGTSPLYAFKQSFQSIHGIAISQDGVLGVLSLIFWALIIVVSIKYLTFILKADNRGEGGIIALVALLNPWRAAPRSRRHVLMLLGLFGACLLYGDGTITPAISVLSAVEGLKVATPLFEPYVDGITVAILCALFFIQQRGTSKIGALFGPVMLLWFVSLAILGVLGIARRPIVLAALHPGHAFGFLAGHGVTSFIILGTIFLAVTGAETLYADMGHFGRRPIRLAWFAVALPALLLNYFGQGALVLADPATAVHPFFGLCPGWLLYPMIVLATAATVIAAQAVISGAFSLTRQAVQFGQLPRLRIVQTDRHHVGQIYIPAVNWALMAVAVSLVIGFRSSAGLAAAYGLAVSTGMVITTILAFFVAVRFGWSVLGTILLAALFLPIDMGFFSANLFKIADGGWYPLFIAVLVFTTMMIWRSGLRHLGEFARSNRAPLDEFIERLSLDPPQRVPGTAIFMTASTSETPSLMQHHLDHNRVLHERVIIVTVLTEDRPRVPSTERLEVEALPLGFHRVIVRYGFMQSPNIPVALRLSEHFGLEVDPDTVTYFLGHEEVIPMKGSPLWGRLRARLFAFMWRNTTRATAFYHIPPERVLAIGLQVEM
jgi:KUP system potassium uptake protein